MVIVKSNYILSLLPEWNQVGALDVDFGPEGSETKHTGKLELRHRHLFPFLERGSSHGYSSQILDSYIYINTIRVYSSLYPLIDAGVGELHVHTL